MKRYTGTYTRPDRWSRKILLFILCSLLTVACQHEELVSDGGGDDDGRVGVLTYNIALNGETETRAIGDGQSVDELVVGVFIEDELIETHTFTDKVDGKFPVSIPLLRNKEYNLVFWAQKSGNGIYTMGDDMQITVDYSKYDGKSLQAAEAFEVFSGIQKGVTVQKAQIDGGTLSLTRPFAQVNVAADDEDIYNKVKRAELTLTGLPTGYNPLDGAVTGSMSKTFTFTDFGVEEGDKLIPSPSAGESSSYTYLATVWALPTTATDITVNLYDAAEGGSTVRDEVKFEDIELKANVRLNIIGTMIQLQTMAAWDGVTFSNPAEKTPEQIQCPMVEQITRAETTGGILHIETPEELAYILKEGIPTGYTGIHICNHLDMGEHDCSDLQGEVKSFTPANLPAGTLISALSVKEGECFTVSNITMSGNGLFGDTQELTVRDITFSNIAIVNETSGSRVGILAGTVKSGLVVENVTVDGSHCAGNAYAGGLVGMVQGNLTVENVHVEECFVDAAASGGLVGYIGRVQETSRAETLEAVFNNCAVNLTLHDDYSGKFVGEFSGYDNGEKLTFTTCTANGDTPTNDEPFFGTETYWRGLVKFGDEVYMPKWDGTTSIEPLLANATYDSNVTVGTNKFVVYSPFDLAGVRKKTASPAAIYLRADIDMNGQGDDGKFNVPSNFTQSAYSSTDDNYFNPFSYVTTLDGKKSDTENWSIYNMAIQQIEQERAAFILYASGTTKHMNINFRNCQTVAVHKTVQTDAKAYGAILVSNVDATYTMENVHAYDCKVFALQKVGTLGARISGTSTLKNNSVNNCYVENYECKISERFSSGEKTIGSWTVTVYADFYPYGEVGGMYGFIQGNSKLEGCKVNGTTIYASGQDDKMATTSGSLLARLGIAALGYYKVPGRHVSTLIGNIRATGTVTLTGCTVDTNSKCTKRHDKHNSTYNYIGQAYIVKFVDSEGTVTVDGKKLTLADCNKNTKL